MAQSVHGGAPQTVVSFRSPMRQLWAFDLHGSQLTWMQSVTPIAVTYTCWQGEFGTTGPRMLQTVDVSRDATPIPAPAPPPPGPDPATIYAQCGPLPPVAAGAAASAPAPTR